MGEAVRWVKKMKTILLNKNGHVFENIYNISKQQFCRTYEGDTRGIE